MGNPRFPYDPSFIREPRVFIFNISLALLPTRGGVIGEPGFPYLVPLRLRTSTRHFLQ